MSHRLTSDERLEVLREVDQARRWYSLDDKRICMVCERVFSGRQVEFDGPLRDGSYTPHCPTPGCPSHPSHWLFWAPPPGPANASEGEKECEFEFL